LDTSIVQATVVPPADAAPDLVSSSSDRLTTVTSSLSVLFAGLVSLDG
jgi:hypothetical protein